MNVKQILDSVYIIPAIIDHIEKPTANTSIILKENGISQDTLDDLKKMPNLLRYHLRIVQNNFQPDYERLRLGLREYHDLYLKGIFNRLGIVDRDWKVLDYGSGDGQLSEQFLDYNPDSMVIKLDKDIEPTDNQLKINFEDEAEWWKDHKKEYDCVLLSEVLHCKNLMGQNYLLNSSAEVLKFNGSLVLIENIDSCMAYRISKIKGKQHNVLDFKDVQALMNFYPFQLRNYFVINHHIIYHYEKSV